MHPCKQCGCEQKEYEGRNFDFVRESGLAVLKPWPVSKIYFLEGITFLYKLLPEIDGIWLEMLKSGKLRILECGDPKIQFWEGVTFLYKFFTT